MLEYQGDVILHFS